MKINVNKNDMIYNIGLVSKAAVSKSTSNILECILIIADKEGIKLTANNLDMAIETDYFNAEVIEEGSIALEGRFLNDVIRSAPSSEITIETGNNKESPLITAVKSGNYSINISGRDPETFPALPEVSEDLPYTVKGTDFKEMIKKTIFAVAAENIKPVLTGEYLEIADDTLNLVGIDGFRIACGTKNILKGNGDEFSVIVPGASMNEISRIISDEEEITLYFTDTHMLVKFKNCTMLTNLIEGEYLSYEKFFTNDFKTKVVLKRSDILSCLDRVLLISKDARKSPVKINIGDNFIELTSTSEILGSMYEKIDCEVSGDELMIGFNPRYFQDIFKNMDADEVTLLFNSPLSPCVAEGDEGYRYLLLPLRL